MDKRNDDSGLLPDLITRLKLPQLRSMLLVLNRCLQLRYIFYHQFKSFVAK